jgi:putative transposase
VPARQPKRSRLWLNDGSCIRRRAEHRNHVWSYDFVEDRTHEGGKFPASSTSSMSSPTSA